MRLPVLYCHCGCGTGSCAAGFYCFCLGKMPICHNGSLSFSRLPLPVSSLATCWLSSAGLAGLSAGSCFCRSGTLCLEYSCAYTHLGHIRAAALGVISASAAPGRVISGSCLCKNIVKLHRETSFPEKLGGGTSGFSWTEGCILSQTFPAPSENRDKSRCLPFCQHHFLAFCISNSWSLNKP